MGLLRCIEKLNSEVFNNKDLFAVCAEYGPGPNYGMTVYAKNVWETLPD